MSSPTSQCASVERFAANLEIRDIRQGLEALEEAAHNSAGELTTSKMQAESRAAQVVNQIVRRIYVGSVKPSLPLLTRDLVRGSGALLALRSSGASLA
jgi:hypothetical protein